MTFLPVTCEGGIARIEAPDGRRLVVTVQGEPARAFGDARELRLYCGLAPIFFLEWRNNAGEDAVWLLDAQMNRLALSIDTLEAGQQTVLLVQMNRLMARLWIEIFQDALVSPSEPVVGFLKLNSGVRRTLFALWRSQRSRAAPIVLLSDPALEWAGLTLGDIGVGRSRAQACLDTDYQALVASFVSANAVTFPSIFGDHAIDTRQAICLDTFRFVYRVVDGAHGRAFYVGVTGHHSIVCALLVPNGGDEVVLCGNDNQRGHLTGILAVDLPVDLLGHACEVGMALVTFFQSDPKTFVNVQRGEARHMGHLLWNELTGIMKLVEHVPADRLPLFVIPDPEREGGELYGPLDRIFPELEGRVVREVANTQAFIAYVYAMPACVIRSTSLIVTQTLRDHIFRYIDSVEELASARTELASMREKGAFILTIGLRVENRTVTNLEEFCERIIETAARQFESLVIVFDGHNALSLKRREEYVSSNQEWRASRRPIDIERALVADMQKRFPDTAIKIVDTVGQPMEVALFWIKASNCFIAPWGTGMAKYSWICNKPGYVLTTEWNIKNRGDIGIYGLPYNENAAPLNFAWSEIIVPDLEGKVLVRVSDWPVESFNNFILRYVQFVPDFVHFLEMLSQISH